MKNYIIVLSLLLITISTLLFSCKKDEGSSVLTYELHMRYWNAADDIPQMRFNEDYSSDLIRMRYEREFTVKLNEETGKEDTLLIIDNVRFVDNNFKQYNINNIVPYYLNEKEDWQEDLQYNLTYEKNQDTIDVVLVLDKSYSLSENFREVKDYAIETVNFLFSSRNDSVRIGVVDFCDDVASLDITNNKEEIINYIEALESNGQTAFYDAMGTAINKLKSGSATNNKAILAFTDGIDNKSLNVTSTSLIEKLGTDPDAKHITTFMIGLQGHGEIDKYSMSNLAVNGGMYQFPSDMNDLQTSFQTFAEIISNTYNLYYTRNNKDVNINSKLYLKFAFELD